MADFSDSFGEALENMTTGTKKAVGGTIADFTKSATNQVKGTGGVSGSFTPGQQPQNPNAMPNLTGGDLFSPDQLANKQKQSQQQQGPKPLTQAGQQLAQDPDKKTPEEVQKIQQIEQELRSMHQEYYQDFLAKAEGRDKKKQVEEQKEEQKEQEENMKKMEDIEEKKKKDQDVAVFQAQRSSEIKGNLG